MNVLRDVIRLDILNQVCGVPRGVASLVRTETVHFVSTSVTASLARDYTEPLHPRISMWTMAVDIYGGHQWSAIHIEASSAERAPTYPSRFEIVLTSSTLVFPHNQAPEQPCQ
jgi:hypothetical protein